MEKVRDNFRPLGVLALLMLSAVLVFMPACQHKDYSTFAKCLASKQVTMYGLYWCEHCAEQKKMFGSAFQYVNYVECGVEGSRAEQPVCTQAGVKNFPTWKFPDGSLVEGTQPMEFLSGKSGC